jgi:molybdopterin-guanine dinucleotide biosynthesis protein MobB
MNLLHIVGRRNHGKTTLLVELVSELSARGLRVGTIKHTSHHHELDTPGKDSHRHRIAGAAPASIVTPALMAVFQPRGDSADVYERLAPWYADCDLVLVEGDLDGPGRKIEVWRPGLGEECLAATRCDIAALVTDTPVELAIPVLARRDLAAVCKWIVQFTAQLQA